MKASNKKLIGILGSLVVLAGAGMFVKTSMSTYGERKAAEAYLENQKFQAAQGETDAAGNPVPMTDAAGNPVAGSQAEGAANPDTTGASAKVPEDWKPELPATEEVQGVKYEINPNIRTILLLGVDKTHAFEDYYLSADGGQNDVVMLLIQDVTTKKVKILMIPRDTMTEMRVYDLLGNYLGRATRHLSIAFSYGNNPVKGSENAVACVTDLLEGVPIHDYMAITTKALSVLNDKVGGVTVTIDDPYLEERDPSLVFGTTMTLKGDQAEHYIRSRNCDEGNSAIARMDHHKQYMEAWMTTAQAAMAKDSSLAGNIMDALNENMVTNIPKDRYLKLGLDILQNQNGLSDTDIITLPGEAVTGGEFDEFHQDPEAIHQLVLELFYRPVN